MLSVVNIGNYFLNYVVIVKLNVFCKKPTIETSRFKTSQGWIKKRIDSRRNQKTKLTQRSDQTMMV